jgi:hypothetical protein
MGIEEKGMRTLCVKEKGEALSSRTEKQEIAYTDLK